MEKHDEHTIKRLTRVLFDQAKRLTENDYDRSCELVQEVWYKVLAHENLDEDTAVQNFKQFNLKTAFCFHLDGFYS